MTGSYPAIQMASHHLLYAAYGAVDYTNECKFALARLMRVATATTLRRCRVTIYTDRSDDWAGFDFGSLNCQLESVDTQRLEQWKGPWGFVMRAKLETMRHMAARCRGHLLYMDTDTHVRQDLGVLLDELEKGDVFMHLCEGPITADNGFSEWERHLAEAGLPSGVNMWNAGLIGVPVSEVESFVREALELSDRIYVRMPRRTCEQLAVSYCLQRRFALRPADEYVRHYWELKESRRLLREQLARVGMNTSLDRLAEVSDRTLPDVLEAERRRFHRHPLRIWRQLMGRSLGVCGFPWSRREM